MLLNVLLTFYDYLPEKSRSTERQRDREERYQGQILGQSSGFLSLIKLYIDRTPIVKRYLDIEIENEQK
jgi:hypothetical protein